jgi:hypothetical protein
MCSRFSVTHDEIVQCAGNSGVLQYGIGLSIKKVIGVMVLTSTSNVSLCALWTFAFPYLAGLFPSNFFVYEA